MFINFKYYKDKARVWDLLPVTQLVLFDMAFYCNSKELPFLVTCTSTTKKEDDKVGRISSTHREGRAFDVSVKGWKEDDIHHFVDHYKSKFSHVAAVNDKGEPVLIPDINHGTAPHIHVQIHRRFAVETGLE